MKKNNLKAWPFLLVVMALTQACRSEDSAPAQNKQSSAPTAAIPTIEDAKPEPDVEADPEPDQEPEHAATSTPINPPEPDRPPIIVGAPPTTITVGESLSFRPETIDENPEKLSFTVENLPDWARFDNDNGELAGVPSYEDAKVYENISIRVSDGRYTSELRPFSLEVIERTDLSVTLSWLPPQENQDGTALFDLRGYKIRYGQSPDDLSNVIDISSPGISTYVVDSLSAGTYYFSLTAYNQNLVESQPPTEARIDLF